MDAAPQATERDDSAVGRHRIRVEPPMFLVENHGPVTLGEFDALMARLHQAIRDQGVCYFLMNVADTPAPSPEVRERMRQQGQVTGLRATIGFGAPPALVLFSRVIRRGLELLRRANLPRFVMLRDEDQARAWVAADLLTHPLPGPSGSRDATS